MYQTFANAKMCNKLYIKYWKKNTLCRAYANCTLTLDYLSRRAIDERLLDRLCSRLRDDRPDDDSVRFDRSIDAEAPMKIP